MAAPQPTPANNFAFYESRLEKDPQSFLKDLERNLMNGKETGGGNDNDDYDNNREEDKYEKETEEDVALRQLDVLDKRRQRDEEENVDKRPDDKGVRKSASELLLGYRSNDDDTLAHIAATYRRRPAVLRRLAGLSPDLLLETRGGEFEGQAPLHIVITKGNYETARAILNHINYKPDPARQDPAQQDAASARLKKLLSTEATGPKFRHTVMMGRLPLSVAALTFDQDMVSLLLKRGANIGQHNSGEGDTVLHSLIRFASVHSDKTAQALEMMSFIDSKLSAHQKDIWHRSRNNDGLNPLKLAASLGQVDLFTAILNLEGVYRSLNAHNGLFDIHLYDITEIDTVTQAEWERYRGQLPSIHSSPSQKGIGCCPLKCAGRSREKKSWNDARHWPALRHKEPAVLDIVCQLPVRRAFEFISIEAVQDLVRLKWDHYQWFFIVWAVYHLFVMVHMTVFAVYKTKVINSIVYDGGGNGTANETGNETVNGHERTFVDATGGLILFYALVYLIQELVRSFYFRQAWHICLIQHNGIYRMMSFVFSVASIIDAVWYFIHPHNNYFLIVALILGWTFTSFFLRTWKRFSFYTVMFQKVLLGDMTRLSVIIVFQLVAFSIAIYTTFLNTRPVPEGFDNAGLAMLTMFKLMLGLGDIEVLHEAREPWLAISLYVLFVLVTYVLLINSLIAMMSRTCDLVSEDRHRQWEFQRLSVILLLETMLLPGWRFLHKDGVKAIRRYGGLRRQDYRCYIEVTSIQTTYTEGKAVLERKSMIKTLGFSHGPTGMPFWTPNLFRTTPASPRATTGLRRPINEEIDSDIARDIDDGENDMLSDDEDDDDGLGSDVPNLEEGNQLPRSSTPSKKSLQRMAEYLRQHDSAMLSETIRPQHLTGKNRDTRATTTLTMTTRQDERYQKLKKKNEKLLKQIHHLTKLASWTRVKERDESEEKHVSTKKEDKQERGGRFKVDEVVSSLMKDSVDRKQQAKTETEPTAAAAAGRVGWSLQETHHDHRTELVQVQTMAQRPFEFGRQSTGELPVKIDEPILQARGTDLPTSTPTNERRPDLGRFGLSTEQTVNRVNVLERDSARQSGDQHASGVTPGGLQGQTYERGGNTMLAPNASQTPPPFRQVQTIDLTVLDIMDVDV